MNQVFHISLITKHLLLFIDFHSLMFPLKMLLKSSTLRISYLPVFGWRKNNLSEMMESISLELLENSGRDVSIEFFIQPDVVFKGDKDAFTSIVTNLVSNALKYSPEKLVTSFVSIE